MVEHQYLFHKYVYICLCAHKQLYIQTHSESLKYRGLKSSLEYFKVATCMCTVIEDNKWKLAVNIFKNTLKVLWPSCIGMWEHT